MTRYVQELPLADIDALHTSLESAPDNPSLTEPLTVGSAFPPGYRPVYDWTSKRPVRVYEADGETEVMPLGGPTGTLAVPSGGYQDGWAETTAEAERPGTVFFDHDQATPVLFSQLIPMGRALAIASRVERANPGIPVIITKVPRPRPGELPNANASWASLGVANDAQQTAIDALQPGLTWTATLPPTEDVEPPLPEPDPLWDSDTGLTVDSGTGQLQAWMDASGTQQMLPGIIPPTYPGSQLGSPQGSQLGVVMPTSANLVTFGPLIDFEEAHYAKYFVVRRPATASLITLCSESSGQVAVRLRGLTLEHERDGDIHVVGAVPADEWTLVMVGYRDGESYGRVVGAAEVTRPIKIELSAFSATPAVIGSAEAGSFELGAVEHLDYLPGPGQRNRQWSAMLSWYGIDDPGAAP